MMKKPLIGVVCLARKTFDFRAANEIYSKIRNQLNDISVADFVIIDSLIFETEDACGAAQTLSAKNIDALICISGTFHLGNLLLELNKVLLKPVFLWGLPELPHDGGKIRLNSICGLNLNASNLYKAGVQNYNYHIGNEMDTDWLKAICICAAFNSARVGLIGYRASGFYNIGVDELNLYKNTGILTEHYELQELYDSESDNERMNEKKLGLKSIFDTNDINETQLELVSNLAARIDTFMDKHKTDAIAIRCWPEFAAGFGISPCAAMSLLQADGRIIACEGDIEGALTMLAHKVCGAVTPFLADFSQINMEENYALLWHCGAAPCNLRDNLCVPTLDTYFAGGKGVTAGFVMKRGEISIARIDSANHKYRLFLQKATSVPMEKELKGTYMKVIFEQPVAEVLDKIVKNGIAHHVSVVYGDHSRPFEILAHIKGWEIIC